MALHTNVGLGDFVLMDDISMNPFLQNLKIRYVCLIGIICMHVCILYISIFCLYIYNNSYF